MLLAILPKRCGFFTVYYTKYPTLCRINFGNHKSLEIYQCSNFIIIPGLNFCLFISSLISIGELSSCLIKPFAELHQTSNIYSCRARWSTYPSALSSHPRFRNSPRYLCLRAKGKSLFDNLNGYFSPSKHEPRQEIINYCSSCTVVNKNLN